MTFAGTSPTTAYAGTSFVTTAPAATTAYSPNFTLNNPLLDPLRLLC